MALKPGTYWIGDLCYVMHDKWDAFCDLTIVGDDVLSGEFNLNGVVGAQYGTAHGDGEYYDHKGRSYCVDTGLIGCILVSDIDLTNKDNDLSLGHIVEFKHDVESGFLRKEEGAIWFSDGMTDVLIKTDEDLDEEEDEDHYGDHEDEEAEEV